MSWLDDMQTRVIQSTQGTVGVITDILLQNAENSLVKRVSPPTGNLSQADLDQGFRGGMQNMTPMTPYLLLVAAGLTAYLVFSRKRRRS